MPRRFISREACPSRRPVDEEPTIELRDAQAESVHLGMQCNERRGSREVAVDWSDGFGSPRGFDHASARHVGDDGTNAMAGFRSSWVQGLVQTAFTGRTARQAGVSTGTSTSLCIHRLQDPQATPSGMTTCLVERSRRPDITVRWSTFTDYGRGVNDPFGWPVSLRRPLNWSAAGAAVRSGRPLRRRRAACGWCGCCVRAAGRRRARW